MNKGLYGAEQNTLNLLPTMLDGSVFTSRSHCQALLQAGEKFFMSDKLYTMLYKEYDEKKVSETLSYFVWRRPKWLPTEERPRMRLPWEKLELEPYMQPYTYKGKEEYIEEIYPYYERSLLPSEVKDIILDEYCFLKEHSSILMLTKRFPRYLHRWGISFLDATHKTYQGKRQAFERFQGVKWLVGILLEAAGVANLSRDTVLGGILMACGIVIAVIDP